MKVYFSIDDVSALNDSQLRGLCSYHCWHQEEEDPHFGVALPHRREDADAVVDRLTALGCDVLPALADPDNEVSDKVKTKLKKHGVTASDKTKDIAKKMHAASGFPPLKPNFY